MWAGGPSTGLVSLPGKGWHQKPFSGLVASVSLWFDPNCARVLLFQHRGHIQRVGSGPSPAGELCSGSCPPTSTAVLMGKERCGEDAAG